MSDYIERYWRDATPQDAIKDPPMVARFRHGDKYSWFIEPLMGIRRNSNYPWYSTNLGSHKHCQVYDAPDPGEGWRLVDVDNDKPQEGDEFLLTPRNEWITIAGDPSRGFCGRGFAEGYVYRRRIEPPKPKPRYEPFRWEDRDQLRGRIVTYVDRNRTVEFRCESFAVDDDGFIVNDAYAGWLCKNAVFVDTKEPVGRRVE